MQGLGKLAALTGRRGRRLVSQFLDLNRLIVIRVRTENYILDNRASPPHKLDTMQQKSSGLALTVGHQSLLVSTSSLQLYPSLWDPRSDLDLACSKIS